MGFSRTRVHNSAVEMMFKVRDLQRKRQLRHYCHVEVDKRISRVKLEVLVFAVPLSHDPRNNEFWQSQKSKALVINIDKSPDARHTG